MEKLTISFEHLPIVNQQKSPQIDWEYQLVCLDCEAFLGKSKLIWQQPWKKGVTENLMRYSLKECISRKKPFVSYFLKIISNKIRDSKK